MQQQEKGSILLIVLIIITSLIIIVYEGFQIVDVDYNITDEMRGYFAAKHKALSGISLAKFLLLIDGTRNNYDSLLDMWAHLNERWDYISSQLGLGGLKLRIEDEASKLPINYLVDRKKGKIYSEILKDILMDSPFSLSEEKATFIVEGIRNWINSSRYPWPDYEPPPPNFRPKNAPFEYLGELLLIPGIGKSLYFGKKVGFGLKDILTVYSDRGMININTCIKPILVAMAEIDIHDRDIAVSFAREVEDYRENKFHREMLKRINWISLYLPEFSDINIPTEILTTSSNYFKITSTGISKDIKCTIIEYVKREKHKIKTLFIQIY